MPTSGSSRELSRRKLRASSARPPAAARRAKAGGNTRAGDKKSLVPRISATLTALTAVLAILISWLTFKMNRDGQISARYTSAVEQLGSVSLLTRVGAVYSLGRIADESAYDRPVIIDMLADYVKEKTGMGNGNPDRCRSRRAPELDVIAAMRVLFFRIEKEPDDGRIDLRKVCLIGVEMPGADLTCVRLDQSVIVYSNFDNAKLVDTSLQHARLGGNSFVQADFTRAVAFNADFTTIDKFSSTDLTGARLRDAEFVDAQLVGVDLTDADLTRTRLENADLKDTDMGGARVATYLGDADNLPPDVDRSAALASAAALSPAPRPACRP